MSIVPIDERYALQVGRAVYAFAYYEWMISYIIEWLQPGFLNEYTREVELTAGQLGSRLRQCCNALVLGGTKVSTNELRSVKSRFIQTKERRDALIHAHPMTGPKGEQWLLRQTLLSNRISDFIWREEDVKKFVLDIESAIEDATPVFEKLRPKT